MQARIALDIFSRNGQSRIAETSLLEVTALLQKATGTGTRARLSMYIDYGNCNLRMQKIPQKDGAISLYL